MSVNIFHKTGSGTGTLQKVAGNTVILDATTSEKRDWTVTISCTANTYCTGAVTFDVPMPDTDYCVLIETCNHQEAFEKGWTITNKTVNGFTLQIYASAAVNATFTGYAFKLITMDGYTELQNKVENPDNVPTQNSDNLVKSGGVWEALKDAGTVFTGTKAEWENLDPTEQERYEVVCITDDEESGGGSTSEVYRNPDWSRAIDLTTVVFSAGYTVPEDGIFIVTRLRPQEVGTTLTMSINNVPFIVVKGSASSNADTNSNSCTEVCKDDFIKVDTYRETDPIYFVPYKSTVVENRIPLNYTTTEQFTGKYWVDGKPIYRKVYNADIATYNDDGSRRTFAYIINDNIDTIISSGGCWTVKTNPSRPETVGWTQTWNVAQMSTNATFEYSSSTAATGLQVMMATALWGGVTGITIKCWVEYTKTN